HMPEKSGFPSRVRGVDAVRLTLPSRVRGTPAVGYFNHCASEGVSAQKTIAMINAARTEAMKCGSIRSFSHRSTEEVAEPIDQVIQNGGVFMDRRVHAVITIRSKHRRVLESRRRGFKRDRAAATREPDPPTAAVQGRMETASA